MFRIPAHLREKNCKDIITGLITNSGTVTVRDYEGTDLHEVALLNESAISPSHYTTISDDQLFDNRTRRCHQAADQDESLLLSAPFNNMYATSGKNVDANVFINFHEFPKSLSAFVKTDFKSEVRSFKNFAGWWTGCEPDERYDAHERLCEPS